MATLLSTQHEQINIPLVFYGDLPKYEESNIRHHLTEDEYYDFYYRLREEISSYLQQQRDLGGVFLILVLVLILFLIVGVSWFFWLIVIIIHLVVFKRGLLLRKKIQGAVHEFLQKDNIEVWNARAIYWTPDTKFKNIQLNLGYHTRDAMKAPAGPQTGHRDKVETGETDGSSFETPTKVILDFKAEPPQAY